MSEHNASWHRRALEGKSALFAVLTTVAISVGGLVEIVPMYSAALGPEQSALVTPYTPLEVAGRDIYIREGCYNCHSQMIRPMKAETLRYGEWTRAYEYQYDRPFQLGSRRIGPDVQRVGAKYPDAWHWEHMKDPRSTSPGSIMPAYPWLYEARIDAADVTASVQALATLGTPYADTSEAWVKQQLDAQGAEIVGRLKGNGIAEAEADLEIVALTAYLQRLGTDGKKALQAKAAE